MNNKGVQKICQRIKEISIIFLWENKVTAWIIYTSLLFNFLTHFGLYILFRKGQAVLITHYNVFFGIDAIVNTTDNLRLWQLFIPPLGGLFFLLLSIVMSILLVIQLDRVVMDVTKKKNYFISSKSVSFIGSRLLLIGAWSLQLVLLIYLIAIWKVN